MFEVGCVACQHLLGYSTLCVCWIGVCRLFGILLLLCWAMRKSFMCAWVQVESRCGHVSLLWLDKVCSGGGDIVC